MEKLIGELSKLFNDYGDDMVIKSAKLLKEFRASREHWRVECFNQAEVNVGSISVAEYGKLKSMPFDSKIERIKALRDITGMGLRDAKEVIDGWFYL
jgi:ribosomal protein L7/L12